MAPTKDVYNPLLFEIAWEVANKGMYKYQERERERERD